MLPEGLFLFAAFFGEVPERRPSIEKREAAGEAGFPYWMDQASAAMASKSSCEGHVRENRPGIRGALQPVTRNSNIPKNS